MAIICRSYNLLFIMTPRTACTAIGEILCEEFGGEYLPTNDLIDSKGFIQVQKKHSTLEELLQKRLLSKEEASSLLKFSTVRNPFDSLVSLYIKKRYKYQSFLADPLSWVNRTPNYAKDMRFCKTHSFDAWIIKSCSKKILKRLLGMKPSMFYNYTKGIDIVMRYENIGNDFQNVLKKAGLYFEWPIPVVNPTLERSNNDHHSYYSKLSRRLVEYVYYYDLKTYGYSY